MKNKKSFVYLSSLIALLITGIHINVNADSKQYNYNTNSQDTIISENNDSDNISFPDASNKKEQVGNYVKSFSTKINIAKSDAKNAKKQLADAKTKNNAIKHIHKANDDLNNLNDNKNFIINHSKQEIKLAKKKNKEAKTDEEHINANVSLNRAKISYSQLNKDLK